MKLYFQHGDYTMELVADGFTGREDPGITNEITTDVHKRNPNYYIYYIRENKYENGDVAYDVGDHNCFYFLTNREFKYGDEFDCMNDMEFRS